MKQRIANLGYENTRRKGIELRKITLLAFALLALTLVAPAALAQDNPDFCGIPEGCDLDGDGSPDVPAGTTFPPGDQYADEAPSPDGSVGGEQTTEPPLVSGANSIPDAGTAPGSPSQGSPSQFGSVAGAESGSGSGTLPTEDGAPDMPAGATFPPGGKYADKAPSPDGSPAGGDQTAEPLQGSGADPDVGAAPGDPSQFGAVAETESSSGSDAPSTNFGGDDESLAATVGEDSGANPSDSVIAPSAAAPSGMLPDTGGTSIAVLFAATLLLAGGILIRRAIG